MIGDDESPLQISNLTFGDGTQVDTGDADIIVLVGPNNVGKTRTLQEIEQFLKQPRIDERSLFALRDISVKRISSGEQLVQWLRGHRPVLKFDPPQGDHVVTFSGQGERLQLDAVPGHWAAGDRQWLGPLGSHLVRTLYCSDRLGYLNNAQKLEYGAQPSQPLHYLIENERLLSDFRDAFAKAFRMNLIIDGFGNSIQMRASHTLTQDDFSSTTDNGIASAEVMARINGVPPIHVQSDGVRSFTGILLTLLAGQFPLVLIDEPEAFLHPPQARLLGQHLAQWHRRGQVFIATHSLDVLLGLIEKAPERVLIVRLTRSAGVASPHILPPSSLANISRDPLLRYSRVLDGLFHHAVILCEAERDCTFYAASLDEAGERSGLSFSPRDVLFVPGGGKDGFPRMIKTLKAVSVPAVVIPDIDLLDNEGKLRTLVEAVGGDWNSFESRYRIATESFRRPRPGITNAQVLKAVEDVLRPIAAEQYDHKTKEAVRVAMRVNPSPWQELKDYGMDAFKRQARKEAEECVRQLRDLGIVLVERGELENLAPLVESRKGPGWIKSALEEKAYRDEPAQNHIARVVEAIERLLGEDSSAAHG